MVMTGEKKGCWRAVQGEEWREEAAFSPCHQSAPRLGGGRGAHCSAGKGKEGRTKAGTVEAVLGGKGHSRRMGHLCARAAGPSGPPPWSASMGFLNRTVH